MSSSPLPLSPSSQSSTSLSSQTSEAESLNLAVLTIQGELKSCKEQIDEPHSSFRLRRTTAMQQSNSLRPIFMRLASLVADLQNHILKCNEKIEKLTAKNLKLKSSKSKRRSREKRKKSKSVSSQLPPTPLPHPVETPSKLPPPSSATPLKVLQNAASRAR